MISANIEIQDVKTGFVYDPFIIHIIAEITIMRLTIESTWINLSENYSSNVSIENNLHLRFY